MSSVKTRGLDFEPGGLPLRGGVAGTAGIADAPVLAAPRTSAGAALPLPLPSPRAPLCGA